MQDTQAVFKPDETKQKYSVNQWPAKAELHRYEVFVSRGKLLKRRMRI